ncbi:MAG: hypothetical protein FWD54_03235 [Endomicrobia bacterium]|nr:hypothetical protein [Endomicrobiia bacterium]MCL2799276.1 hypothetical protein [Endomicrobiia bacterium]
MTEFNVKENMFHKPPMLLVDEVLEESADKGKTSFEIRDGNIFIGTNGIFSRAALIEIAAQSFAAVDKFQKMRKNLDSSKGFLASVKSFEFFADTKSGDKVICVIEKTDEIAHLHIIKTELFVNDKKIAAGEFRIFEFADTE